MSKKRKRGKTEPKRDEAEAAEAAQELAEDTPTRFSAEAVQPDEGEEAERELAEDQPTRFAEDRPTSIGERPAEADQAEEDDEAPTGVRPMLRALPNDEELTEGDVTAPAERLSEDHRFDFGSEGAAQAHSAESAEIYEEPPDPGSADAASPRLQSIVESLLFAADRPLNLRQLADLLEETEVERVRSAVAAIEQAWRERGVQLHEVAGGYQFRTHPANATWVQKLLQQKPVRLSRALLETLAICAYRQPITRPEIDEIRGVDSGGTLKTLMDRALVRILGKREEPGRPLLYGTTKEFLEFFSLRDLKDLPTLREYHELSEEHRAQVAALEGKAPEGAIMAEGEVDEAEAADALPRLSRLEITAPKEDAAELAEIDRLIRSAGTSIATDSDLPAEPSDAAASEASEAAEDLATTGKYNSLDSNNPGARVEQAEASQEFDEERSRTGTFGDPLPDPDVARPASDFEGEEATRIRRGDLDSQLVDERDPDKEPAL